MQLSPRILLTYWTAAQGSPTGGFAFAFLSFIYQRVYHLMFLLYCWCQIKYFQVRRLAVSL